VVKTNFASLMRYVLLSTS